MSDVTGEFPSNPRLAYHFGFFSEIPMSNNFSFNPEILYFSIGSTFDFNIQNYNVQADPLYLNSSYNSVDRANFLSVPLNLRYKFTNRFGLDFGPQISFLLNSVSKIKESSGFEDQPTRIARSGNFRLEYGANLGLSFILNDKVNLQLRYYQGLKNLSKSTLFPDQRSFNIALQLSVGYKIF